MEVAHSQDLPGCWQRFVQENTLTETQQQQFKTYMNLLLEWNELMNLTAITDPESVVLSHFQDSLALVAHADLTACKGIADVGSGGGFPGIPLKIMRPDIFVVLVEVSNKKQDFLNEVIRQLSLEKIEVNGYDWRTFVRKTNYALDVVCARASLRPDVLVFMFKPSSPYKQALLVYWAARTWQTDADAQPYFVKEVPYAVGHKKRKLIFLKNIQHN